MPAYSTYQRPQRLLSPMASIQWNPDQRLGSGLCWLLAVLVFVAYWPALHQGFVNYGDPVYVTGNAQVQTGLGWDGLVWAFTTHCAANWHPVTWLSHMTDYQLFGLRPWAHHLVSISLHLVNTILVFLVLQKATGAVGRSFFAAALFGLHPLQVESVAWVAERKDVLSTLFWLLTLWFWLSWIDRQWERSLKAKLPYALALLACALGLMSKPMLVTVPFTLLLLDVWPLARFPVSVPRAWGRALKPLLIEKIPFFVLSFLSCAVTVAARSLEGVAQTGVDLEFFDRVGNAVVSYGRYLGKMAWPLDLAVFYPQQGGWPELMVYSVGALLTIVTALVVWQLRWRPYLFMGWSWFLIVLSPTIGLIPFGLQAMADRYVYVAGLGPAIMVSWGAFELRARWKTPPVDLVAGLALVLLTCLVLTRRQLGFWEDDETLFRRALAVTNRNGVAHLHLADALAHKGMFDGAQLHFYEAVRLLPEDEEAREGLANFLQQMTKPPEISQP